MKTLGAAKSSQLDPFLKLALIVDGGKCIGYYLKSRISSKPDDFSPAKRRVKEVCFYIKPPTNDKPKHFV